MNDNKLSIYELISGKSYTNNNIAEAFGCSSQGGMRRSHSTNTLVLISKHNNPLYDDYWDDETSVFHYTGMGRTGDQSDDFMQNKVLKESNVNGVKCHLFESYKDNEYIYRGRVALNGEPYNAKEIDKDGNYRTVIKFPLHRIKDDGTPIDEPVEVNEKFIIEAEIQKTNEIKKYSKEAIKNAAINKESRVVVKRVYSKYIERDLAVKEYTKDRAMGKCDLCKKEAPFFKKDGTPYLESHHVIALSENGPDVIYNTVALCPNCHRKLHVRKDKEDKEIVIEAIQNYILKDNNKDNIEKFNKLFKR